MYALSLLSSVETLEEKTTQKRKKIISLKCSYPSTITNSINKNPLISPSSIRWLNQSSLLK
jgi:hypothetical protein